MRRLADKLKKFWHRLGPGLVTGASDNDPSGIATYSIAGAKAGSSILWTMPFTLPLMIAVQEMAARIGISSSCGLAGNIKRYYSKGLLFFVASLIIISNVFNIGADIAGMSAAIELLIPIHPNLISWLIVLAIVSLIVILPYRKIVAIFKWLALSLLAYVIAGFISVPDWPEILMRTITPKISFSRDYIVLIVAIFGTTISPYLAFWQASEEAEEKKDQNGGKIMVCKFRAVPQSELKHAFADTRVGMFFSNFTAFFIIALVSSVLYSNGFHGIETIKDAAEALRPLAGNYSYLLFTLGIVSAGLLAIPILAGSVAYAVAEIFGWEASLDKPFSKARGFYIVVAASTVLGMIIPLVGIKPVQALFYTAILHGIVAPVLIGMLIHMSNNPVIVGSNKSSAAINVLGFITMLIMAAGSIIFFATL